MSLKRKLNNKNAIPTRELEDDPIVSSDEEYQKTTTSYSFERKENTAVGYTITSSVIYEEEEFHESKEVAIKVVDKNKQDQKIQKKRQKDEGIKWFSELPRPSSRQSDECFKDILYVFNYLKEFSFSEFSIKYRDKKDKDFEKLKEVINKLPTDVAIAMFAVDPGTTSCGIALFNILEEKAVSVQERSFREKGQVGDVGHKKEIMAMHEFFSFFNHPAIVLVIEDQVAAVKEHHRNVYEDDFHFDAYAIQYALQGMFYNRCIPVSPNSIKHHFKMPKVDKAVGNRQYKQYQLNKEHAVKFGKFVTPQELQQEILLTWKHSSHNIYDAILIGYYVIQMYNGVKNK